MGSGWLTATVSYHPIEDVFRYITFALSGAVIGRVLFIIATGRLRQWSIRGVGALGAWVTIGAFAILQEANQLHQPMLVWRMPLLLLIDGFVILALYGGTEEDSVVPPKDRRSSSPPRPSGHDNI